MTVSLIAELTDCEELSSFFPCTDTEWVFRINLCNPWTGWHAEGMNTLAIVK
jgi:hypothetical protein